MLLIRAYHGRPAVVSAFAWHKIVIPIRHQNVLRDSLRRLRKRRHMAADRLWAEQQGDRGVGPGAAGSGRNSTTNRIIGRKYY